MHLIFLVYIMNMYEIYCIDLYSIYIYIHDNIHIILHILNDHFLSHETCHSGSSSRHLFERLRLDEPWHGNVLLSCGPHKLEPKQQLQEFNADFVPWLVPTR